MIQRKQSLFLLAASISLLCLFFFPYANIQASEFSYIFNYNGISILNSTETVQFQTTMNVTILIYLTLILTIGSIFLFKKRIIQIKACILNTILLLGLFFLLLYYPKNFSEGKSLIHSPVQFIPVIACILNFLAIHYIRKDEELVKSIDRIR